MTQFPITSTVAKFDNSSVLCFVGKKEASEMLRHQPHSGSDPANDRLAVLHRLSNRDKHRFLLPLFAFINPPPMPKYTFDPPLPPGTVRSGPLLSGPRREARADEIFYKGDMTTLRLGWIELTPRPPNTKIDIDPQPPLDVLFSGPGFQVTVPDIEAITRRVEFVVGRFARFL